MGTPTVLIVEDDRQTRDILVRILGGDRMLRYHNIRVLTARDGQEGLEIFQKEKIHLLITDILMPRMDGFKLIEAIRRLSGNEIPVLITTGVFRDIQALEQMRTTYNLEIVTKPFNLRVLADKVRSLLAQRLEEESVLSKMPQTSPDIKEEDQKCFAEGDLAKEPLPKVLFKGMEEKWDGILQLKRGNILKDIFLAKGHPIFVRSNQNAENLGQLLLRRGLVNEAVHRRVSAYVQRNGCRYGEALVHLKIMTENQVLDEVTAQTRYKLEVCLDWKDGTWRHVDDLGEAGNVPKSKLDLASLVFEGLKRHANKEDALGRLSNEASKSAIALLGHFEKYRKQFIAVFDEKVLSILGKSGAPVMQALQSSEYLLAAQQLDVLLLCGLAELRPLP